METPSDSETTGGRTLRVDMWSLRIAVVLLTLQVMLSGLGLYRLENVRKTLANLTSGLTDPNQAQMEPSDVPVSSNDAIRGDPGAPVTIVEFSDFDCPYCKQEASVLSDLLARYGGKVRLVYRDYPVHATAARAAEAARCAQDQGKFWEMHDWLFQNTDRRSADQYTQAAVTLGLDAADFKACLSEGRNASRVAADQKAGAGYGVRGTPAFFVNGKPISGAVPATRFEDAISEALQELSR